MKDLGYLNMLLDEVVEMYNLSRELSETANLSMKAIQVLQELIAKKDEK